MGGKMRRLRKDDSPVCNPGYTRLGGHHRRGHNCRSIVDGLQELLERIQLLERELFGRARAIAPKERVADETHVGRGLARCVRDPNERFEMRAWALGSANVFCMHAGVVCQPSAVRRRF